MITSKENQIYKDLSKLSQKKYIDETGTFLVFGEDLLQIAQEAKLVLNRLTTTESSNSSDICLSSDLLISLQEGTKFTIGAKCKKREDSFKPTPKMIYLDNIQDPRNVGAIIRSAVGFNFSILLSSGTCDIYNQLVLRTSKGYSLIANISRISSINELEEYSKEYLLIGASIDTNNVDYNIDKKIIIVMGNEGHGIDPKVDSLLTNYIKIPTSTIESLNVSVAAGILMHKFYQK